MIDRVRSKHVRPQECLHQMQCGLKCFPNVTESEKAQNILYPIYTPTRPSIVGIQVNLKT